MTSSANRMLVVALASALACSLALGAAAPVAAGGVLVGDASTTGAGPGIAETIEDTVDEAGDLVGVDGTNATVANGTNATVANGTANGTSANETSDATADGTTPTPESTPEDTATGESNDTGGVSVEDTVQAVGDGSSKAVNETATATTDSVDETVNATGATAAETVNGTGETVEGATNETGETVGNVTGDVTGTVDDVAVGTTNATSNVTEPVDRTVSSTTGAVGNLTAADTDVSLTAVVDGTGTLVRRTTDAVTDAVVGTVESTDTLIEGVVERTVGQEEDPGTAGDHGWPTADGESTEDLGGHWAGDGAGGLAAERVDLDERAAATGVDDSATDADGTDEAAVSGGATPRGPVDPGGGGAAVGAVLVVGSLVATRTGMAASTMSGGATGFLQGLFAAFRGFLLRVAVLAGYSRYDFEDPLENENRAAVLETVESSPGINLTSLVEATDLSESTVRYHLRVLEHEDLLEGAKVRGRRRYVPRTDDDLELVAAFEEEATRDVLATLFEYEPATGTTLAEALERDPSTVSHHLSRLAEAGLVDREQDGPALRNSLAPKVRRAFSEVEVTASVQGHAQADD